MEEPASLYERAKAIALEADGLPAGEREAFLASACGGDAALRAEVDWFLKALVSRAGAPATGQWLDQAVQALTGRPGREYVSAAQGGQYRVLSVLGQGGMGTVYLAERSVGGAKQQVALKMLNAQYAGQQDLKQRFAAECRILATLDHPNIARLVDAGSTPDDQPYLAMEYVQGNRVDQYCRQGELPLAERIGIFIGVCGAVQYAHQRLVVHRDLKPANILVDDQGQPRLLDFGIARLLGDGSEDLARTATDHRLLTLAYASPEQVRGEPLTAASDIWSLGVILYELVSGQHPFAGASSALDLSNAIITGKLVSPGRRLDATGGGQAGLRRVPADIDAIVMKALRTDPADRYATVAALQEDLRAFLTSRPVKARRGAGWYRVRLFFRRHRGAVAAAAVVLGLLVAFGVERERQLRTVEQERDTARALAGFMGELFENADPTRKRGERITVAEVLDKGVADLNSNTKVPAQVQASLLLSIGRAYNALDRGDKALPVLERARALQDQAGAAPLERGRLLAALGRAYSMVIDLESSARYDRQAVALLQRTPGASAEEILRVRINGLYSELGVRQVPLVQIRQELRGIVDGLKDARGVRAELLAQALAASSLAAASAGDNAQAIGDAQRARSVAEAYYGSNNAAGLIYYQFVQALVSMRTDPAGAVALYRTSVAQYQQAYGSTGAGLAGLLSYLGDGLLQLGKYTDAEQALREARRLSTPLASLAPDFYQGNDIALAEALLGQGRLQEARTMLAPLLPRLQARAGSGASWAVGNWIDALDLQARLEERAGDVAAALAGFRRVDAVLQTRPAGELAQDRASAMAGLGRTELATGDLAAAKAALARLQAFNQQAKAPVYATGVIEAAWLAASLAHAEGDIAGAARLAGAAAPIAVMRWGESDPRSRGLLALAGPSARTAPSPH